MENKAKLREKRIVFGGAFSGPPSSAREKGVGFVETSENIEIGRTNELVTVY